MKRRWEKLRKKGKTAKNRTPAFPHDIISKDIFPSDIVSRIKSDGEEKERARMEALRDAEKLSFAQAMHLFQALDERELAARYILDHQKKLATPLLYGKGLNALVKWLADESPDAAILLLRDAVEKTLESAQSKNYPWAIRHLKKAFEIEKAHPDHPWQITPNREYTLDLLQHHKKKYRFVTLFDEAFPDLLLGP